MDRLFAIAVFCNVILLVLSDPAVELMSPCPSGTHCYALPEGCKGDQCQLKVLVQPSGSGNKYKVDIIGRGQGTYWIGAGFSKDQRMKDSLVTYCRSDNPEKIFTAIAGDQSTPVPQEFNPPMSSKSVLINGDIMQCSYTLPTDGDQSVLKAGKVEMNLNKDTFLLLATGPVSMSQNSITHHTIRGASGALRLGSPPANDDTRSVDNKNNSNAPSAFGLVAMFSVVGIFHAFFY